MWRITHDIIKHEKSSFVPLWAYDLMFTVWDLFLDLNILFWEGPRFNLCIYDDSFDLSKNFPHFEIFLRYKHRWSCFCLCFWKNHGLLFFVCFTIKDIKWKNFLHFLSRKVKCHCSLFGKILSSGVAVGAGMQAAVAIVNLVCFYVIGLPLGALLGYLTSLEVKVYKNHV